jgi:cephalosporin-C deacetylase
MFLDSYLMARLLNELHPSEKGLGAMGMSQGGGLAIWLGAYCSLIRAVVADMPFLAGMEWVLSQKMPRYPLKELADFIESAPENREALVRTLSYFDTLTQAGECYTPTLVTQGKRDPAVRPDQVKAIFEALPGTKELVEIDWGHDWHPSMVERNQEWLERYLT